MHTKRLGLGIAAITMTAGLIIAPQLPAFAAASAPPPISITATSHLPKVTGDVFVAFLAGRAAHASVSGTVASTTSPQVLRLYAQQFPFKKAFAPLGAPINMPTGGATPYSFTVTPTLATHYKAELFPDSTSTTPIASSAAVTVYVVAAGRFSGIRRCSRPVCHETIRWRNTVPAVTVRSEISKPWYVYFGLNLSRIGVPPRPRFLRLGAGGAHVTKARRVAADVYSVTITFSFRVGNNGYYFVFLPCQKDIEAKNGLNLPGHHGCGTLKVISSRRIYLG